jgi:hypothetical protein
VDNKKANDVSKICFKKTGQCTKKLAKIFRHYIFHLLERLRAPICILAILLKTINFAFKFNLSLTSDGWSGAYLKGLTFPKDLRQRGNFGGP